MKKREKANAKPQARRRRLDQIVLHPYQANIFAAMLSDKPITILTGRKCGITYAERMANQIKVAMDKMQNLGIDARRAAQQTIEAR